MYEKYFGLNRRPFLAKVSGSDVFVGPQTAQTMASLRKALQVQDAVVLVAGAPGCGKSTLVVRALEAVADTHRAVRIGRMNLRGADVLEYLLEELGETELPKGPIRQFALLRDRLAQLESDGTRIVIVVEDALRLGAESLAELEALTAADAGESGGAALVVMGDTRLGAFLPDPQLTRLAQRIHHTHQVRPMSEPELRGYLLHCIRQAGGSFEKVFEPNAAATIRDLSQGITRVANKIVEAAMSAAAATKTRPISADLIAEVARKEFGLKTRAPMTPEPVPSAEPVVAAAPESVAEPVPEPASDPVPEPSVVEVQSSSAEPVAEPEPADEAAPAEAADPIIVFADAASEDSDDDIPELIQDTLPDLEVLVPEVAVVEPSPEPESVPTLEPAIAAEPDSAADESLSLPDLNLEIDDAIAATTMTEEADGAEVPVATFDAAPALELETSLESANEPVADDEPQPAAESPAEDIPEWDRDPTLAELMPDLDALEKAMAFAQGEGDDAAPDDADDMPVLKPEPLQQQVQPEEIPEITLDNAIQQRVDNNLIDEPGSVSRDTEATGGAAARDGDIPEVKLAPRKAKKADAELERIAAELAKAKTIEDVDDKLAETLFGEELSLAAAEVAALVRAQQSSNDEEASLFDTNAAQMAQAVGSPVIDGVEVALESSRTQGDAGLDPAASQRLNTLRSLHSHDVGDVTHQSAVPVENTAPAAADVAIPEPIEDQINTSLTQTLKALDVAPPVLDRTTRIDHDINDDDDDDKHDDDEHEEQPKKGGFFSRFRRS